MFIIVSIIIIIVVIVILSSPRAGQRRSTAARGAMRRRTLGPQPRALSVSFQPELRRITAQLAFCSAADADPS